MQYYWSSYPHLNGYFYAAVFTTSLGLLESPHVLWLNIKQTHFLLQDFIYPENVAYPIGGPGSARFLVMEMHYDNPDMRSGTYVC